MQTNVEFENTKVKKPSLFGIITSPTVQFIRMKEKAPIGVPLICIMLIGAITGALGGYISFNNPLLKNLNSSSEFHLPVGVTIGIGAGGALISAAIMVFIMAAIYKIFMVFMGNDTPYMELVSIVIYTSVISYLGSIINCLIALALKGYSPIYTSLAPLVGDNITIKAIAGNFDIFQIWHYIVLAVGLQIVAGLSKKEPSL